MFGGITRDSILRIAADQGLTVKEKRITRDEVYVADEAFFTGTAAGWCLSAARQSHHWHGARGADHRKTSAHLF